MLYIHNRKAEGNHLLRPTTERKGEKKERKPLIEMSVSSFCVSPTQLKLKTKSYKITITIYLSGFLLKQLGLLLRLSMPDRSRVRPCRQPKEYLITSEALAFSPMAMRCGLGSRAYLHQAPDEELWAQIPCKVRRILPLWPPLRSQAESSCTWGSHP